MDAEPWGVQLFEFVWFKVSATGETAAGIYRELVGSEADGTQTNRVPTAAIPFLSQASGLINDRIFQVTVHPARIEFQVACPDRASTGPWAWKFEDGVKGLRTTQEVMRSRIDKIGTFNRVAFHLLLMRNVASLADATQIVLSRIGQPAQPDVTDIVFQLNRVMRTPLISRGINRILRFGTSSIQQLVVGPTSARLASSSSRALATLNLDINTVPGSGDFKGATAAPILDALIDEAVRIASIGSIKGLLE